MKKTFVTRNEQETLAAGHEIARILPQDAVVHLVADLGSGKTTLVRGIAAELGADPVEVASPSFAIVHEYPVSGRPPLIHIDGYRLSDSPREWFEIGIDEMLAAPGLKFIEWPKEGFAKYGRQNMKIEIHVNDDDSRTIDVEI